MSTCRFCSRKLSNPRHAAAGVGPSCAKKHGLQYARVSRAPRIKREKPHKPSPWVDVPLPFNQESPQ